MAKCREEAILKWVGRVETLAGATKTHGTVHRRRGHCRQREVKETDCHTRHPMHGEPAQGRQTSVTFEALKTRGAKIQEFLPSASLTPRTLKICSLGSYRPKG